MVPLIEVIVVQHILVSLSFHKGQDPDSLLVLKIIAPLAAQPLADLSNLFHASSEVPDNWRIVIVCPIRKKGNREETENYCILSMTSVVWKLIKPVL